MSEPSGIADGARFFPTRTSITQAAATLMTEDLVAQLTVGIPVFNEERFIAAAIASAVTQCGRLKIFDNASTDRTGEICTNFSRQYPGISYFRHERNIGAVENFQHALFSARTPFFMWLGAHDLLAPGYAAYLLSALRRRPEAVLAFAPAVHVGMRGEPLYRYEYHYAEDLGSSDPLRRVYALVHHLDDCSLIHGIFRTDALRQAWAARKCLGADHVVLCNAAALGPLVYVPDTEFLRREVHAQDSVDQRLRRMTGEDAGGKLDCEEMMCAQYRLIKRLGRGRLVRGACWRERARFRLLERFGMFATGPLNAALNRLAVRALRAYGRYVPGA